MSALTDGGELDLLLSFIRDTSDDAERAEKTDVLRAHVTALAAEVAALRADLASRAFESPAVIARIAETVATDVVSEGERAGRVLDWIGVAADLPLSERVKWLAVELACKQGYTLDEATRLADAVLEATGTHTSTAETHSSADGR